MRRAIGMLIWLSLLNSIFRRASIAVGNIFPAKMPTPMQSATQRLRYRSNTFSRFVIGGSTDFAEWESLFSNSLLLFAPSSSPSQRPYPLSARQAIPRQPCPAHPCPQSGHEAKGRFTVHLASLDTIHR